MTEVRRGADYQIGQAIQGRWRIRATAGGHGKSGMGIVYIADDLETNGVVAIKTFQPELVANAQIKHLLLREANVWLEMGRHQNIVCVERIEIFGTQLLIFMEYIAPDANNRNCLSDYLQEGPPSPETMATWALEICAALAHMRACGIEVHRDLKPDNILIAANGTVKVTDFGLARAFEGFSAPAITGGPMAGFTLTGGIVGTPGYIAPEIVVGQTPDVRSDIFSFGLILAQMITGQRSPPLTGPWPGDAVAFERANLEIRRTTAPPTTRSPLHGVVVQCLQIDPAKRYAHFPALATALRLACSRGGIELGESAAPAAAAPESEPMLQQALAEVDALRKLGRHDEALAQVRLLRRQSVLEPRLLDAEGLLLTDTGDLERAIELLETACELQPDDAAYRNNLGRAYRTAEKPEAAHMQFAKALELGGESAGAWVNLAICELDLERYADALFSFDRALALDPHYVFALLGRAQALHRLGRNREALTPLSRAMELEPDQPGAQQLFDACVAALR